MTLNYQESREAMVLGQLLPQRITHPKIIQGFKIIPREEFTHPDQRGFCYSDSALPIDDNRIMLSPAILARLLQEASITHSDSVLALGCSTGYSALLLSYLASKVIAIETNPAYVEHMNAAFEKQSVFNARAYLGTLTEGFLAAAPYTVIFIEGQIEEIPSSLVAQLEEGGRIVTLLTKEKESFCYGVLIEKRGHCLHENILFETQGHILKEFQKKKGFEF